MKTSNRNISAPLVIAVGCIALAAFLGWRLGFEAGGKKSAWMGAVSKLNYLLGVRLYEERGKDPEARKHLNDALYLSAGQLALLQDSAGLDDSERAMGAGALRQVAEYHWRHPETYTGLDAMPELDARLRQVFDRHKPDAGHSGSMR